LLYLFKLCATEHKAQREFLSLPQVVKSTGKQELIKRAKPIKAKDKKSIGG
jgi:hypothetical protein